MGDETRSSGRIEVVTTTISGSIKDWGKVGRIVPLFAEHGFDDVRLSVTESHAQARTRSRELVAEGARTIISAGGSGTFNAVLEGCCDAGAPLDEIRLGFLRKGSADLIGKALGMPDEIESAIAVFAAAIRDDTTMPCDILLARDASGRAKPRHFVGYGGAGLFGRIPHYTENRFMKWYKGVLGVVFGDLGPFTTGMTLALGECALTRPLRGPRRWRIVIDNQPAQSGAYHALVIVNGHLGRDLPYAADPLGSGHFHLFGMKDLGLRRLPAQALHARRGRINEDPARWGWEAYTIGSSLALEPEDGRDFPLNVDGSTLVCRGAACVEIVARIHLFASS